MNLRDRLLSNDPWTTWQDGILLFIRIFSGLGMFVLHGVRKWNRLFTEDGPIQFADPLGFGSELTLYIAIFAEIICALLIVFGFRTRLLVIPLILTMLVVIFRVHISDPLSDHETPVLYLLSYGVLLVWGGGKYSVDYLFYPKSGK